MGFQLRQRHCFRRFCTSTADEDPVGSGAAAIDSSESSSEPSAVIVFHSNLWQLHSPSCLGRGKRTRGNEKREEKHKDVVHVRARRGQDTDSHSLAERVLESCFKVILLHRCPSLALKIVDNTIKLLGAGAFAFHPTLEWILVGDRRGTLLAWDVSTELPNMIGIIQLGSQPITSVSWLSTLRLLVTLSKDGALQVCIKGWSSSLYQRMVRALHQFLSAAIESLDILHILSQHFMEEHAKSTPISRLPLITVLDTINIISRYEFASKTSVFCFQILGNVEFKLKHLLYSNKQHLFLVVYEFSGATNEVVLYWENTDAQSANSKESTIKGRDAAFIGPNENHFVILDEDKTGLALYVLPGGGSQEVRKKNVLDEQSQAADLNVGAVKGPLQFLFKKRELIVSFQPP
ncbi:hypothetical protein RHGRI_023448 [Rhododendron griersonianum]|uniref:Uncharacterized protein n=1 Tax=Rhododendron griersonianum TaxID=479676 RepID=A0AAV6J3F1_9ERIC|nr:hypothetical protein RHGRI_023448 [Rhododendron griersonianum]